MRGSSSVKPRSRPYNTEVTSQLTARSAARPGAARGAESAGPSSRTQRPPPPPMAARTRAICMRCRPRCALIVIQITGLKEFSTEEGLGVSRVLIPRRKAASLSPLPIRTLQVPARSRRR